MKRLQSPVVALCALAAVMLLLGTLASTAHAQIPPYTSYGDGVQPGATVEAFINGKSCGSQTVNEKGQWIIQISNTAPCSPTDGQAITFTLNGQSTVALETWKAGGAPKDIPKGINLTLGAPGTGPVSTSVAAKPGAATSANAEESSGPPAIVWIAGLLVLFGLGALGGRIYMQRRQGAEGGPPPAAPPPPQVPPPAADS